MTGVIEKPREPSLPSVSDGSETDSVDNTEKGGHSPYSISVEDDIYHFDASKHDGVQRRLKQRHVQMIAIAGTIGTGLFLGSGEALAGAGPLGVLLAYFLVGTIAYSSLCSIGEMTSHAPISGTFPHFASRWVDPAFGFAVGWNYFYTNAISVPVEITAATILLNFWDTQFKHDWHQAGYTALICVLVCAINIFGVRYFGESEFVFSLIKIAMIIGLLIAGLIIDLGGGPQGERIGFRYWKDPGPIARAGLTNKIGTDRFLALLSVLVQAAFSLQGMELVAIAASETESPRRNIAKAVRRVFYRILVFYMLGILMIGMLVSSDDPSLLNNTGVAASPFVIAIQRAGIKILPHIINAGIITSAFSAGNSYLFCGSRILYGLALSGQAPHFLTYCNKKGLPLYAVLVTSVFSLLSFFNTAAGSTVAFGWFVNLSTTAGFFSWAAINLTYIRFNKGMRAQGFNLRKLTYNNPLQPYLAYWGLFWTILLILINGFAVFFSFNASDFFTAYINIVIFFGLYFAYKFFYKTHVYRTGRMDFVTGIPSIEETEKPEVLPVTIWQKIAAVLF